MEVQINLVGAIVPIAVSVLLLAFYWRKVHWLRIGSFTLVTASIFMGIATLISIAYKSISAPGWSYILVWLLMIATYTKLRFARGDVWVTTIELYAIGTFGVFLDDAARTMLGLLGIPYIGLYITPNIWGAAGPIDGIFLTGLCQAIIYYYIALAIRRKHSTETGPGTLPDSGSGANRRLR